MALIYIVEDDENIRELVIYALNTINAQAIGFESSIDFKQALKDDKPDLILLDVMLPGRSGLDILKDLRQNPQTADLPIIMLTAKSSEYDKVKGLDYGADDYITKPFSVLELLSRVKALLRRSGNLVTEQHKEDTILAIENLTLDIAKHIVTVDNQEIILTYKEFELLQYLMENRGIVLSRDKIMTKVWGFDFEGESRTVDMHIKNLRRKLGTSGKYIETIRGIGYKIS